MDKNQTINKNKSIRPVSRKITDMRSIKSINHKIQVPNNRPANRDITRPTLNRKTNRSMDVSKSRSVSKFAPNTNIVKQKAPIKSQPDIGHIKHPLVKKVETIRANNLESKQPIPEKTAKQIKDEAITKALNTPKEKVKKDNIFKRHSKKFNIISISAVAIVIIGVLVYVYMPVFSVSIASAQAGISATYPEYHPDGYGLSGPVAYSNGEVTMTFQANTGNSKFIIKQSKSSWDSSAVKNKVDKDSKGEFTTTEEKGLTIYTYNGNAAWVNGGILYNITGDAPLSGEQIQKIATSL